VASAVPPVFRELNLRILAAWRAMEGDDKVELVCECRRLHCTRRILLYPVDYEAVLGKRGARLVIPGHQDSLDRVVTDAESYLVVVPRRRSA
jgi:hypothetical protein